MNEIIELTAVAMAARLQAGSLSASDVAQACLARIEACEPTIHAWQYLDAERVRACARRLDSAAGPRGLLHGVPIGIKDVFDTVDMPTSYGSTLYRDYQPPADATAVSLSRAAGALLMGKTVTTEFAAFSPGATRNPHDSARTPGGSSSGSAAAVAAGMVPLALGTQTAGSIIRPASFCGIFGYKPTRGLFSPVGVKTLAWSLDTVGLFSRSAEDMAFAAGVLSRRDLHSGLSKLSAPRIGICRSPQWLEASASCQAKFDEAVDTMSSAGAEVVEIELSQEFDSLLDAQKLIMAFEAANALAFERTAHPEALSPSLTELLARGTAMTPEAYDAALSTGGECRRLMAGLTEGLDGLLTLSAPDEAPRGEATGDPVFDRIWTLLGMPCVNVPGVTGDHGLPIGVQVVGRRSEDARALSVADWLYRALNPADQPHPALAEGFALAH